MKNELFLAHVKTGNCLLYVYSGKSDRLKLLFSGSDGQYVNNSRQYVVMKCNRPMVVLFGVENCIDFAIELPINAKIELDDQLCVYLQDGVWRTKVFVDNHKGNGKWKDVLLGVKHNRIGHRGLVEPYYLEQIDDNQIALRFIIGKEVIFAGVYSKVEYVSASLMALRKDGCYDIFYNNKQEPVTGEKLCAYTSGANLMIWDDKVKGWRKYEGFSFWATNAIYTLNTTKEQSFMELYNYKDGNISLVAKGDWKWEDRKNKLLIDGMIYSKNPENGEVDFDNPKPTIKRRIKDFFKNLFK
ncbi:MAG: hypothetical protein E7012_03880 [Alphaproteobacteria bacterium]|nr:hypothetical protein [Alphaproteobacteria bacterium]